MPQELGKRDPEPTTVHSDRQEAGRPTMPCKHQKRIELSTEHRMLYSGFGEHLRRTVGDLNAKRTELLELADDGISSSRAVGYGISVTILQALMAEYLLKALAIRETGGFLKTHDLYELYEDLPRETREHIAALGTCLENSDMPSFLNEHRNDFVERRYLVEDLSRSADPDLFELALGVLSKANR